MKTSTALLMAGFLASGLVFGAMAGAEDAKKAEPQTKCPVMGGDVNKKLYVDADGKRIYVCCPGCIDSVKKNPQKYIKEMEAKGIVLDKAK